MRRYDYDIIILGGGGAGITAALLAKGLGKKVLLIDRKRFGGECTWSGCVPSKALIKTAKICHSLTNLADYGLDELPTVPGSGPVMDDVRRISELVYESESGESFEKRGITAMENTSAKFIDTHTIEAHGKRITAKTFIIATGSSPLVPPIPGLAQAAHLTNETVFSLKSFPHTMAVLGGGPIGVELAQAFSGLGTEVTLLEMADSILFREDGEITALLTEKLRSDGITVLTGAKVVGVSGDKTAKLDYEADGIKNTVHADVVLVALGRKPNRENLGLEEIGVACTGAGITVDRCMRTSVRNIYAAGDVAGPYQFSHMANYQAVLAASNALLPVRRKADYRNVPWCIFTDPELGRSGLTENQARERFGDRIRIYRCEYRAIDRAVTDRAEFGLAKVISARNGNILGIHILGERAGEVMHELHLAKCMNIPLHRLRSVIRAYPCYSDLVKSISGSAYIDRIRDNPLVKLIQRIRGKR